MRHRGSLLVTNGQAFVAAVQLLSRFPMPVSVPFEEKVLRRSVLFYPLVGLIIGIALAAVYGGASAILPGLLPAALTTGVWVAVTGGFHLDGLMDTADGVLSHRSRERMLEIMKDSRVGAMGVIVCVIQLLMKFALLVSLGDSGTWLGVVLLAAVPVWSRWFMVAAIALWPYAREGQQGMGAMFREVGARQVTGCSAVASLLSLAVLAAAGHGFAFAIVISGMAVLISGCSGTWIAVRLVRKLGGLTGDTYGALNELLETVLLLAAVLLIAYQGAG